jgi:hypothetical protein
MTTIFVAASLVATGLLAQLTSSPECTIENGAALVSRGPTRTPVILSGPALAVHCRADRLYVARGPAGVAVFDISDPARPQLIREVAMGTSSAVGFHLVDGQLWVVLESRSAVPLTATKPEPSAPEATPKGEPSPPAPPRVSTQQQPDVASNIAIRGTSPGSIEIDAGASRGVRVGDRFAVYRSHVVASATTAGFTGEELVTVVDVVAVKDDSALAQLPRGALVFVTDHARAARADQSVSIAFPPRIADIGEVSVVLRPIVKIGTPVGFAMLADIEGTYWGGAYFAGARIQPLGLGGSGDGSVVSTAALAEGGYDGQAFAVGLGAGMSWVNGNADRMLRGFGSSLESGSVSDTVVERQQTHSAFTLSQYARLGARDGLNLVIRNALLLHENAAGQDGFIYGGTTARFAIPFGYRSDIVFEGGGGIMGYWFAGAGVATWLGGSGAPGSWRLSVSAGGAGVWGSKTVTRTQTSSTGAPSVYTYERDVDISGPMVSLGLLRRFSF